MSYESVKLALNPVAWYRNDEESGTVMGDSSGNGLHQAYENLTHPTHPVLLGQLSGVETVAVSRSVYATNRIARIPVAESGPLDSRVTFSWEVLVRQATQTSAQQTLVSHNESHNCIVFFGTGNVTCRFQLRIAGTLYSIDANINPLTSSWYHVIGVRNGGTMFLMLNGVVVASRSDLPAGTPITVVDGNDFIGYGGTSQNNTLQFLGNSEELTLYDYGLTSAQGTEVYESMINAVFLSGRADAGPTGILRSDFEPDPIHFPWRHNWTEPLVERISFRSAISQAVDGDEESVSMRIAPRRELEFTQVLKNHGERRKLRAQLWAGQAAKWWVPLRMYADRLLVPVSASATTTAIDTQYKDYEVGYGVEFRQLDDTGAIEHAEVRLITAVNSVSIEHEPLTNSYAAYRSLVQPMRRALLPTALSGRAHSDAVEELTVTARLLPEDESLAPNRITAFNPTIKYRDAEVFDGQVWQSNDWSELPEFEIERSGEVVDFENGLLGFESDTVGAWETFTYRMLLEGHDVVAQFLGWYYERVGALQPLWVSSMRADFTILSVPATATITVHGTNYSDSYALAEARRDLAFVYFDGSMQFRRVLGFSGTPNETLQLNATVPSLTNLRFVSLLKYCRLDADQLELAWQTDNVVQVAWRFRELLHTPEGVGPSSLSPSASRSGSVSPSASASPSASTSPSLSPSLSPSPSSSVSPSASLSPSLSASPSGSESPSPSLSASPSASVSSSPSASVSPSGSVSLSPSPSASASPSV